MQVVLVFPLEVATTRLACFVLLAFVNRFYMPSAASEFGERFAASFDVTSECLMCTKVAFEP